jgi:hypothetical protein
MIHFLEMIRCFQLTLIISGYDKFYCVFTIMNHEITCDMPKKLGFLHVGIVVDVDWFRRFGALQP